MRASGRKMLLGAASLVALAFGRHGIRRRDRVVDAELGRGARKELADKFQAANPGITIKLEVTVSDGLPRAC